MIEDLPFTGELMRELRCGATEAERAEVAQELHRSCQHLRALSDRGSLSEEERRIAEEFCVQIWQNRERIVLRLGPSLNRQVRADLMEVAIWLADLRKRRKPVEPQRVLRQVETFGPNPDLDPAKIRLQYSNRIAE